MIDSKSQTLITGVYRTGTEYLTQLVNCHPHLSATMYSVNVPRFVQGHFDPIHRPENYLNALSAINQRTLSRYGRQLDIASIFNRLKQTEKVSYALLYDLVMTSLYLGGEKCHWAEKNQLLWREIPEFISSMRNGHAVLVVRDPRSVLASFKKYTYAPAPAYLGAIFNCLDAMMQARLYLSSLPKEKFLVLRYEDIAISPQLAAEKVWNLIGLTGTANVSQSDGWMDAYGNPWGANSSFHGEGNIQPFNLSNSIARWKGNISQEELELTESVCRDVMNYFGYEVTTGAVDWLPLLRLFVDDDTVLDYFRNWLRTGEGIQAFPTDPLKPENWRNC